MVNAQKGGWREGEQFATNSNILEQIGTILEIVGFGLAKEQFQTILPDISKAECRRTNAESGKTLKSPNNPWNSSHCFTTTVLRRIFKNSKVQKPKSKEIPNARAQAIDGSKALNQLKATGFSSVKRRERRAPSARVCVASLKLSVVTIFTVRV